MKKRFFLSHISVCDPPPKHTGRKLLAPPSPLNARAIFQHNVLLCNDTHSKTGEAQTEKDPEYFPFVPPPPVRYATPVTDHVSLHSKALRKNMGRASGDCK